MEVSSPTTTTEFQCENGLVWAAPMEVGWQLLRKTGVMLYNADSDTKLEEWRPPVHRRPKRGGSERGLFGTGAAFFERLFGTTFSPPTPILVPSSTLSFPVCSHLWRIFGVSLAYLRVYLVYHKVLCKLV